MNEAIALKDLPRRDELAQRIVAALGTAPQVVEVEPYGSLSDGRADRYSDLDFAVTVRGISDREFAHALPGILDPIGPRLVDGWGSGFCPARMSARFIFRTIPCSGTSISAA